MSKLLVSPSLILCVVSVLGCGRTEQGSEVDIPQEQPPQVVLNAVSIDSPLTNQELSSFLQIVDRLPNGKIPSLNRADFSFSLNDDTTFETYVEELRQSLLSAMNPDQQAASWKSESELDRNFSEAGVAARDFAALATKVSLAWSATSVRGVMPILFTQRKLDERLAKVRVEFEALNEDPANEQDVLQRTQELVALSEFLKLMHNVPEESLDVINSHDQELEKFLPRVDLAAEFEKFLDDTPEVKQTQYSIR